MIRGYVDPMNEPTKESIDLGAAIQEANVESADPFVNPAPIDVKAPNAKEALRSTLPRSMSAVRSNEALEDFLNMYVILVNVDDKPLLLGRKKGIPFTILIEEAVLYQRPGSAADRAEKLPEKAEVVAVPQVLTFYYSVVASTRDGREGLDVLEWFSKACFFGKKRPHEGRPHEVLDSKIQKVDEEMQSLDEIMYALLLWEKKLSA